MNEIQFILAANSAKEVFNSAIERGIADAGYENEEAVKMNELVKEIANKSVEDFIPILFNMLFSEERVFEAIKADAVIPTRSTTSSACYDLISPHELVIPAGGMGVVETGIRAKFPTDEVLMLYSRSGMGFKSGIVLVNGTGIIDADYYGNPENDGEILVGLRNLGAADYVVKPGDKIAQCMFCVYNTTSNDNTTATRQGGLGSTGR